LACLAIAPSAVGSALPIVLTVYDLKTKLNTAEQNCFSIGTERMCQMTGMEDYGASKLERQLQTQKADKLAQVSLRKVCKRR